MIMCIARQVYRASEGASSFDGTVPIRGGGQSGLEGVYRASEGASSFDYEREVLPALFASVYRASEGASSFDDGRYHLLRDPEESESTEPAKGLHPSTKRRRRGCAGAARVYRASEGASSFDSIRSRADTLWLDGSTEPAKGLHPSTTGKAAARDQRLRGTSTEPAKGLHPSTTLPIAAGRPHG